jgi:hypothetical protein
MYKKQLLLLFGLFVSSLLFAQINENKDEAQVGKYTIKIIPNQDNTYGFQIMEFGNTIVSQKYKPFSTLPEGFKLKSNALLIGKYIAEQFQTNKENKKTFVSADEAKKIGVTSEDLKNK